MEQSYRPDKDLRDATVVISSTTTSDGNGGGTTLIDTALTQGNDYWNNMAVVILSGSSLGQIRRISDFTAVDDTITVDTAFASQIASGTKYNIIAQHVPASGAGDATAANQTLMLADMGDASASTLGSLYAILGNPSATLTATLALKPSATDIGVRQVFEKAITAATNAGATTLGTITTQACVVESIVIYTNAALQASTTCAVTGGAGAVTFIDAGTATAANLAADGNQVAWTGAVRLAATKTIITTLTGGAGAASNLVFIITYYSSSANGGTIV